MRLNINLATQPYQDLRAFLFRWVLGIVAVAVITLALLWAAVSTTISWHKTKSHADEYRAKIAQLDAEQASAKALLDRPENRATRDKSTFINRLISRKAFSWTEVLTDLESILPSGIQVVGITPQISDEGELQLRVAAAGPSRERAIELISRMEASSHFRNAMLMNDVAEQNSDSRNPGPPTYRFDIAANYVPSYQRTTAAQHTPELAHKAELAQKKGGR